MFLPCTLLLVLHTFTLGVMMDALGLAAVCGALFGYLCLREAVPRRLYAGLLTPVMYIVLGGYVWIFVLWVTALEWGASRPSVGLAFKIGYPLMAASMPVVAYLWLFRISLTSAFAQYPIFVSDLPREYRVIVAILYGYLLIVPFWPSAVHRLRKLLPERWRAAGNGLLARALTLSVLVLTAIFLFRSFYRPTIREVADYTLMYQEEDWDGRIARARRNHRVSCWFSSLSIEHSMRRGDCSMICSSINRRGGRADWFCSQEGRRPDRVRESDFFFLVMYNSDLLFQMGHINMAYHEAFNQVSKIGPSYRSFQRIAECHMANGRYEAVRKYLRLLQKTMFLAGSPAGT